MYPRPSQRARVQSCSECRRVRERQHKPWCRECRPEPDDNQTPGNWKKSAACYWRTFRIVRPTAYKELLPYFASWSPGTPPSQVFVGLGRGYSKILHTNYLDRRFGREVLDSSTEQASIGSPIRLMKPRESLGL